MRRVLRQEGSGWSRGCGHQSGTLERPPQVESQGFRLNPPSGPTGRAVTAQGHPRRIFATAIERGNIVMAEATARELGRISLKEALALTALVAEIEPERRSRFAVRWLRRLLEEDDRLTIEEATMAASCLAALGGPSHEEAYGMLLAMAERATRQRAVTA
jgi:hypothetical protein